MERLLGLKRLSAARMVAELQRHEDVAAGFLSRAGFAGATLAAVGIGSSADVDASTRAVLSSVFDAHDAAQSGRASTLALAGAMSVFSDHDPASACDAFFSLCTGVPGATNAAESAVREFTLAVLRMQVAMLTCAYSADELDRAAATITAALCGGRSDVTPASFRALFNAGAYRRRPLSSALAAPLEVAAASRSAPFAAPAPPSHGDIVRVLGLRSVRASTLFARLLLCEDAASGTITFVNVVHAMTHVVGDVDDAIQSVLRRLVHIYDEAGRGAVSTRSLACGLATFCGGAADATGADIFGAYDEAATGYLVEGQVREIIRAVLLMRSAVAPARTRQVMGNADLDSLVDDAVRTITTAVLKARDEHVPREYFCAWFAGAPMPMGAAASAKPWSVAPGAGASASASTDDGTWRPSYASPGGGGEPVGRAATIPVTGDQLQPLRRLNGSQMRQSVQLLHMLVGDDGRVDRAAFAKTVGLAASLKGQPPTQAIYGLFNAVDDSGGSQRVPLDVLAGALAALASEDGEDARLCMFERPDGFGERSVTQQEMLHFTTGVFRVLQVLDPRSLGPWEAAKLAAATTAQCFADRSAVSSALVHREAFAFWSQSFSPMGTASPRPAVAPATSSTVAQQLRDQAALYPSRLRLRSLGDEASSAVVPSASAAQRSFSRSPSYARSSSSSRRRESPSTKEALVSAAASQFSPPPFSPLRAAAAPSRLLPVLPGRERLVYTLRLKRPSAAELRATFAKFANASAVLSFERFMQSMGELARVHLEEDPDAWAAAEKLYSLFDETHGRIACTDAVAAVAWLVGPSVKSVVQAMFEVHARASDTRIEKDAMVLHLVPVFRMMQACGAALGSTFGQAEALATSVSGRCFAEAAPVALSALSRRACLAWFDRVGGGFGEGGGDAPGRGGDARPQQHQPPPLRQEHGQAYSVMPPAQRRATDIERALFAMDGELDRVMGGLVGRRVGTPDPNVNTRRQWRSEALTRLELMSDRQRASAPPVLSEERWPGRTEQVRYGGARERVRDRPYRGAQKSSAYGALWSSLRSQS